MSTVFQLGRNCIQSAPLGRHFVRSASDGKIFYLQCSRWGNLNSQCFSWGKFCLKCFTWGKIVSSVLPVGQNSVCRASVGEKTLSVQLQLRQYPTYRDSIRAKCYLQCFSWGKLLSKVLQFGQASIYTVIQLGQTYMYGASMGQNQSASVEAKFYIQGFSWV